MHGLELGQVAPSALVSPSAALGVGVTIGHNAIVYDNVILGDGVVVGPNVILGEPTRSFYTGSGEPSPPLTIGAGSVIRAGSILYAGSTIGDRFESGNNVSIREGTAIGDDVRIGSLCDLQGECRLGSFVRLHSNVHVGQKSDIASYVWIFPYTVLTNDPHPPSDTIVGVTIEEFAVVATMVVVLAGVRVGRNALVGAMALVRDDVEEGTIVVGNPAKPVGSVGRIRHRETGEPVYPWPEHFSRGMPWEDAGFDAWQAAQARR